MDSADLVIEINFFFEIWKMAKLHGEVLLILLWSDKTFLHYDGLDL